MTGPIQLFHGLPIEQPPGEDYFLASVVIDDPSDPCWNVGWSVFGSWKVVRRAVFGFRATDPRAQGAWIGIAQGDKARERLKEAIKEELRYQQQKWAQPNN